MSTSTPTQESPRVPWPYLGGMLVIFIGFFLSYFGGFLFSGGSNHAAPSNKLPYLALIGLGVAVFAFGAHLLARMDRVRGCDMSLIAVVFIMMPLPALASYVVNFLGNYLRRTASTTVQVVLIGVGVFLLTLAGNWAWDLHDAGVVRVDLRAFAWPVLADFGVTCLLLAVLPMFESAPVELNQATE